MKHLEGGRLVVVAFDVEHDGGVALRKGSAAHWGVIAGVEEEGKGGLTSYLVHGKKKGVVGEPLQRVIESNAQLEAYAKTEVGDLYLIPSELEHLKGLCLLL